MDKDLKTLKAELENIVPKDILEKSKAVGDTLSASIESHKNLHDKVVIIAAKITQAKKELEIDVEELTQKRTDLIAETNKIFNDRAEKGKLLDDQYRKTQNEIGSLEATIVELNARINSTQKNLDSLVLDKNQMNEDIAEFGAYIQSLRIQEQELKNSIAIFTTKKNQASQELVDIQNLVDEAKNKLQNLNNEIIISQERVSNLNR